MSLKQFQQLLKKWDNFYEDAKIPYKELMKTTFQRSSLKGYSQGKEKDCEKKILENFEKVLEDSKIFSFEFQTGERI